MIEYPCGCVARCVDGTLEITYMCNEHGEVQHEV